MRVFQNPAMISISSATPLPGEKLPDPHLLRKVDLYGMNRVYVKGLICLEVVSKPISHRSGILLEVRGI
jgi:hypothetical protein